MTPPVLIVKPDRETDGETASSQPAIAKEVPVDERRESSECNTQRMRAGLSGLLTSTDRTHTIAVLYSLNAPRVAGRVRPMDPGKPWPVWLVPGSRLWLSGDDGLPLRIRVTVMKLRGEASEDDEQFAEFVVPPLMQ